MAHFDFVVDRRTALWRSYARALAELEGVQLVDVDIDNTVPFNLVVRVRDRDRVFRRLKVAGIGVGVHYPPNHTQPAFERWYRRLPATEQSAPQLLSLPFHPAMTATDVTTVVAALADALEPATTT
jgi:dTDP-4-amino-4,6-dideoxygalactose transaminase